MASAFRGGPQGSHGPLVANRSLVVGSPALVVEGRLQKKDGTLSIRAERIERMSLEEPIPELNRTVSAPYPRGRKKTPPSHDFR